MLDPCSPDADDIALEACRAYARTINTLDVTHLEPWLHKDMVYESQQVFGDIRGRRAYSRYLRGKLLAIRKKGSLIRAEIAHTNACGVGPCVILAQGSEDNWNHTLIIERMQDGKIKEMSMCLVPTPFECRRTGEQPK